MRVFGTRDCEPRIGAKGEHIRERSRTSGVKFSLEATSAEKAAREPDDGLRDSSDSLGTPASKGWRGFQGRWGCREGQRGQAHGKVRHPTKPGSPKQRTLARGASRNPQRALQAHAKGEHFRDPLSGARKARCNFTFGESPARCERKRHARKGFRLRSESVRDSCPQASQASGRAHSTSRRFSGCGTWLPKPFCVPPHVCS